MSLSPRSGRIRKSDGTTENIVDVLGGGTPLNESPVNINNFSPQGDRIIGEDGNVYSITQLFKNLGGGSGEPVYKVKGSSTDAIPDYLDAKVDTLTIVVENNKLVVKNIDGLTIGTTDLNDWLSGTTSNIQNQLDDLSTAQQSMVGGMEYRGKFETKADLNAVTIMSNGDVAVVLTDESRSGGRSMYIYSENLGSWDFVGNFEFSDEFIALSDTPNSYVGNDGKLAKVDETNNKLVFDNVDYSEISNKPSSSVANIDDAANKRHTHSNKSNLDRIGIDANGDLTIDGVPYVPKSEAQAKQFLYARLMNESQQIPNGSTLIFDTKAFGDIPYNTSTGEFTLEAGKSYSINATLNLSVGNSYTSVYLIDAETGYTPEEGGGKATFNANNSNTNFVSGGSYTAIIVPNRTRKFILQKDKNQGSSNDSMNKLSSNLVIQEV